MKIKQRLLKRMQTRDQISCMTKNALKCSAGKAEGLPHRITKFWLMNWCLDNGVEFATEVSFHDHQRCDFVIMDWCVGFEVLSSEAYGQFINKSYPIITIPIPAIISPDKIKEMLDDMAQTDGATADFYLKRNTEELLRRKNNDSNKII